MKVSVTPAHPAHIPYMNTCSTVAEDTAVTGGH